jgi:hypothetical protein
LKRIDRIAYRSSAITPDTAEAMRRLEKKAQEYGGVTIQYEGPNRHLTWETVGGPNLTQTSASQSLRLAGREVNLRIKFTDWKGPTTNQRQAELNVLWELAVPLGFIPWVRYPHPNTADTVFHFFGPWRRLHDHLCSEGRGELAWPSVACAAQVDIGTWEGDRITERFVQAQLHRLGAPCGPIDGIIGDRTTLAFRSLGFQGMTLEELAEHLRTHEVKETVRDGQRQFGYIVLPGWQMVANSYGDVHTTHIPQGVALTVDGPGRVVIDVDHAEGTT